MSRGQGVTDNIKKEREDFAVSDLKYKENFPALFFHLFHYPTAMQHLKHLPTVDEYFISHIIIHNTQIKKGKILCESKYVGGIQLKKDYDYVHVEAVCKATMKQLKYDIKMRFSAEDVVYAQCSCVSGYVLYMIDVMNEM